MTEELKEFLIFLSKKFNTNEFSIEEAKQYLITEENYNEKDFSFYWQKAFSGKDDGYILFKRENNTYFLTRRALKLIPKETKAPWTHSELISIISIISSAIVTLGTVLISNLFN